MANGTKSARGKTSKSKTRGSEEVAKTTPTTGAPAATNPPTALPPSDKDNGGGDDGSGGQYYLSILNRHWYRRRLDKLDHVLNRAPANPTVREIKQLCRDVIHSFMTSVAGQAPDSDRLQFPADRIYYIPFEGDRGNSFEFVKSYYRMLGETPARLSGCETKTDEVFEDSVWSFFPWDAPQDGVLDENSYVSVSEESTDDEARTMEFDAMLRHNRLGSSTQQAIDEGKFVVLKSLLRSSNDKDLLADIVLGEQTDESAADSARFRSHLARAVADAVVALFHIYDSAPGNAAIENLLLEQLQLLRWLHALTNSELGSGTVVSQQNAQLEAFYGHLLKSYFLPDGRIGGTGAYVDTRNRKDREALANAFWMENREELSRLLVNIDEFLAVDTADQESAEEQEADPEITDTSAQESKPGDDDASFADSGDKVFNLILKLNGFQWGISRFVEGFAVSTFDSIASDPDQLLGLSSGETPSSDGAQGDTLASETERLREKLSSIEQLYRTSRAISLRAESYRKDDFKKLSKSLKALEEAKALVLPNQLQESLGALRGEIETMDRSVNDDPELRRLLERQKTIKGNSAAAREQLRGLRDQMRSLIKSKRETLWRGDELSNLLILFADQIQLGALWAVHAHIRNHREKAGIKDETGKTTNPLLETLWARVRKLGQGLPPFKENFLSAGFESSLEDDLRRAMDKPPIAGDASRSMVWVCPDFVDFHEQFEETHRTLLERTISPSSKEGDTIEQRLEAVLRPYTLFIKRLDAAILSQKDVGSALRTYWRTRGQDTRRKKVFGCFEDTASRIGVPHLVVTRSNNGDGTSAETLLASSVRPQNYFLRVKIVDTLNEPVLNGMFVITTDHDERRFKNKTADERSEDAQDLLAFSKVFFFIVRDFLRSLDRAQDAQDIGRLNQHLYDTRLTDLDDNLRNFGQRVSSSKLQLADPKTWSVFSYNVVNNYARALIDRPPEARIETFPFDRLVIIPLNADLGRVSNWSLPFYLFQSIFVERKNLRVQGDYYSLLKPFQSTIDDLDQQSVQDRRFTEKSFQTAYISKGREISLDSYLEKLFLGSSLGLEREGAKPGGSHTHRPALSDPWDDGVNQPWTDVVESHVVKAFESERGIQEYWGTDWADQALRRFWRRSTQTFEIHSTSRRRIYPVWKRFLQDLTASWKEVQGGLVLEDQRTTAKQQWFLLRFSLLRAILSRQTELDRSAEDSPEGSETGEVSVHRTILREIEAEYERDLLLQFDNDDTLHILQLARADSGSKLFRNLEESCPVLEQTGERDRIDFQVHEIREDRFTLLFLECLTELATNDQWDGEKDSERTEPAEDPARTWYQPLLTRPHGSKEDKGVHGKAAESLATRNTEGKKEDWRLPPYSDIEGEGGQCLATFLGVVNVVDDSAADGNKRRLRAIVAMIRDFDDTKTNVGSGRSEDETREQLETDRRDLTLFTTTYFRNVRKFVVESRNTESITLLSGDVTQIARNWYSSGIDAIVEQLEARLERDRQRAGDGTDLGRLRPETMGCFFRAIIDVLFREEHRPDDDEEPIKIESFPFDRLLHLPILHGASQGACLLYERATLSCETWEAQLERSELAIDDPNRYALIRRLGRSWSAEGGTKMLAHDRGLMQQHQDKLRTESGQFKDKAWPDLGQGLFEVYGDQAAPLAVSVLATANSPRLQDRFVRSLYEAHELQALAAGGMLLHLLEHLTSSDSDREALANRVNEYQGQGASMLDLSVDLAKLEVLRQRLATVVEDSVRTLERAEAGSGEGSSTKTVRTQVHMDASVTLAGLDESGTTASAMVRPLGQAQNLPLFKELFRAVEGDDWVYGLQDGKRPVESKVFYVYYAITAPPGFLDVGLGEDRQYRGLFCLLLDDASTDLKDEEAQRADQQDIKTFMHNSASSLRQILNQQATYNELLKPGMEQFVTGMMHRVKNELSVPAAVLDDAKGFLEAFLAAEGKAAELRKLRSLDPEALKTKAERSIRTIDSVKGTFKQMKGLSDKRQAFEPLLVFTSEWLGWKTLEFVCTAAQKELTVLEAERSGDGHRAFREGPLGTAQQTIGEVKASVLENLELSADHRSAIHLQRLFSRVSEGLERVLKAEASDKSYPRVLLSTDVSVHGHICFLGSLLLEEAMNILIENAFQAFWGYMLSEAHKVSGKSKVNGDAVEGLLLVSCKESTENVDEVFIEITNSTKDEISPVILARLRADVPTPIDNREHAVGSKKKGGSGFGHYYAREIVREKCGGPRHMRRLDARFVWKEGAVRATTRVNLLGVRRGEPELITGSQIVASCQRSFDQYMSENDWIEVCKASGEPFVFPGGISLDEFVEFVQQLGERDRRRCVDRFVEIAADKIRRPMEMVAKKMGDVLVAGCELLTLEDAGQLGEEQETLLQDLSRWLARESNWQGKSGPLLDKLNALAGKDPTLLGLILSRAPRTYSLDGESDAKPQPIGTPAARALLARAARGERIERKDMLDNAGIKGLLRELARFDRILDRRKSHEDLDGMKSHEELAGEMLEMLTLDEEGNEAPDRAALSKMLLATRWHADIERVPAERGSGVRLSWLLIYGDALPDEFTADPTIAYDDDFFEHLQPPKKQTKSAEDTQVMADEDQKAETEVQRARRMWRNFQWSLRQVDERRKCSIGDAWIHYAARVSSHKDKQRAVDPPSVGFYVELRSNSALDEITNDNSEGGNKP